MSAPADSPPPPARRLGWRDGLIAAVLIVQVALPLSYYLGRSDSPLAPFDERFAWRMFSPVRLAKCQVRVYDATGGNPDQTISLSRELHVVWINLLNRARPAVLERAVERFCGERGPSADIRLRLSCTRPDATAKTICEGDDDRNRDGIPDAYVRSHYCEDLDPKACFASECGGRSASRCYQEECRVQIFDRERNLCHGFEEGA
ncbi:MAG: hypothetical protein R3F65_21460 [bacterium]|nr:hypothetical protein [Myxococcales bacterium]MCB9543656.1 hypothetical protein [Myxococcales bacterium]MCB9553336.1 hypothetical protein [Myxococcales bacterium]